MNRLPLLLAAALLSCSPPRRHGTPADPAAFVSLFDGTTLDGWTVRTGRATYRVEDGAIVGRTAETGPNTFLCTRGEYDNFELLLEVKCDPDLNSGIQVRSRAYAKNTPQASKPERVRPAGTVYGPQVEISANGNAGRIWDEARHTRWHDPEPAETARKAYRPGEWNRYRIVARGDRLRTWINDVPVADVGGVTDVSGFIGLQVHAVRAGTGPFEVRWRNLRIREISVRPGFNRTFEDPDVAAFEGRWEREGREIYDLRGEVLRACGLRPGTAVADVGAGTGLYTRLFAPAVGDRGRVYAVDIARKFVDHVLETCRKAGHRNVEGIVCRQDDTMLPAGSIDLAFVCATYHHLEFPRRTMRSIHRALRPGGRMIVIDFDRREGVSSEWVLDHVRAGRDTVVKEITSAGFVLAGEKKLFRENFFLVFGKR